MSKTEKFSQICSRFNWMFRAVSIVFILLSIFLILIPDTLDAATFTVVNTNDSGPGSLRMAINAVNASPGADTILFNIPGTGVQSILPDSHYAPLVDPTGVFIDGLSQPGSSTGGNPPSTCTLMVEVNGINAGYSHGFKILSPDNTIQGLIINNFEKDGIRIQGIGGNGTYNNFIYSNFIGTDPSGTAPVGNGRTQTSYWAGVNILVTPDTVGYAHLNTVEDNLISSNYAQGVSISNCPPGDVHSNIIYHNYIGTDFMGIADLGNVHDGVYIGEGAHDNTVDTNIISGNDFEGVCIVGFMENGIVTYSNVIISNLIGVDVNINPLPNNLDGVCIGKYGDTVYVGGYAQENIIDNNIIAFNGHDGVCVWEHPINNSNADGNLITRNSIYDNDSLGIDLDDDYVTFNDLGDPDFFANQDLNFPVIQNASYNTGLTVVAGTLDVNFDPRYAVVEIFKSNPDPSGHGEGAVYLGFTNPDSIGSWCDTVTGLNVGDTVTCTTSDQMMNTSEFSAGFCVFPSGLNDKPEFEPVYKLERNIPNPFYSSTSICFSIPAKSNVKVLIYDCTGRKIRNLMGGLMEAGRYSVIWDGKDDNGKRVTPGVYLYRLEGKDCRITKKLIYIK